MNFSFFQLLTVLVIIFILQVGVAFLLVILLVVLAIGVVHYWASNNFYLTRIQMFFVCFLVFLLALAAFLVGFFEGNNKFYIMVLLFYFGIFYL